MKRIIAVPFILFTFSVLNVNGQTTNYDLSKLAAQNRFEVINRELTISNDNTHGVHLSAKENDGVAWIEGLDFSNGIIEIDIKGKDVIQQSFVGIAFHGKNDSAYDCIYFRPFNFNTPDTVRKSHCVQYISMPQYDWQYLREKFPNKYENRLTKSIDANNWFHAKIVVDEKTIKVFVNDDSEPSLIVTPLNNYTAGKIGFWVGNNSDGNFANLTITKL